MSASWLDPRRPWTVRVGDCRAAMADMDPDSVDATVTDTPYGLSTVLDPPRMTQEAAWRRIMDGRAERSRPLQEHLAAAIYEAFERDGGCASREALSAIIEDALSVRRNLGSPFDRLLGEWLDTGENPRLKGRGFMGNEWDCLVPPPNTWRAVWRVQKPGAYLFAFAGARTHGLIDTAIRLADFDVDDEFCCWYYGQGMPKRVRLDLKIDQHFGKAGERPVVGTRLGLPGMAKDGSNQRNGFDAMFAGEATGRMATDITTAATPEATRFVGWDRARRPAFEPIIVAAKPLAGTIAENALRYGTGGLNVDACRIERGGGFPSNVILDEAAAEALDASVAGRRFGGNAPASGPTFDGPNGSVAHGRRSGMNGRPAALHGEVDGPSRFFYVAKAATSERDKGLEAMPVLTPGERSGREDGSAGINGYAGTRGEARNIHPTVKAVTLMRYLVRMACPPGAWDPDPAARPLVLDPFMGSGSTGVACMVEGVRFVGAEMSEEYAAIARARLQHAYALPREAGEAGDGEDGGAERPRSHAAQGSLW